jgi:anti-sigma factor RsiW
MAIDCKKTIGLLGGYHDRQLRGRKLDEVSEHLRQCESCSDELESLRRMSRALKEHYEGVASDVDLSSVWAGVDAASIEAETGWRGESPIDRLIRLLWIPKPAWAAVAVIAVAIVIALAYAPGNHQPSTLAANDCIIDSVESEGFSVMVYEVGDSKMKMIWVMEQPQEIVGETEAT